MGCLSWNAGDIWRGAIRPYRPPSETEMSRRLYEFGNSNLGFMMASWLASVATFLFERRLPRCVRRAWELLDEENGGCSAFVPDEMGAPNTSTGSSLCGFAPAPAAGVSESISLGPSGASVVDPGSGGFGQPTARAGRRIKNAGPFLHRDLARVEITLVWYWMRRWNWRRGTLRSRGHRNKR